MNAKDIIETVVAALEVCVREDKKETAMRNGTRVRVKIPGHPTRGQVVETVAPGARPTARSERHYFGKGARDGYRSAATDEPSTRETLLVRLFRAGDNGYCPSGLLYRVPVSMVEET